MLSYSPLHQCSSVSSLCLAPPAYILTFAPTTIPSLGVVNPDFKMESPENEKVEVATQDDNPLGLEEAERRVLAAQIAVPPSNAGYLEIYRYADRVDVLIMVASAVLAATAGAAMPLMMVRSTYRLLNHS